MEPLLQLIEWPIVWLSHRFACRKQEKPPVSEDALATCLETGERVGFTAADFARHCYILGSTGCGKTTLILRLIAKDIAAGHSLVVVDLRGDLVSGVLGLCATADVDPSRVTILDLREKGRAFGFNPLAGAGEPFVRALHVLDVLASESPSWGVQLEETLRSALLLLANSGQSLTRLHEVFFDSAFRDRILKGTADQALTDFWARYDAFSAEKQQAWALPVFNKVTSLLSVPNLRRILGECGPIDLGDVLGIPGQVLLVSLAVDELQRSARMFGSLVVSAIAREMLARVDVPEKDRNPVRLYVDEFENMASESFEGLIAEGRRFKLSLVLSHQTLAQLPAKLRSVVRNNVGLQVLFQVGFEDAQVVARELGPNVSLEDVRQLGVGEAFVQTRDGDRALVQFDPPLKKASDKAVRRFRAEVLARCPETVAVEPAQKGASSLEPALDLEEWL